MEIAKKYLDSILLDYNNLHIPFYQRGYDWEITQVVKLLEDVSKNKNKEYYLGALIFKEGKLNTKSVIDGQQRLTTIWLF